MNDRSQFSNKEGIIMRISSMDFLSPIRMIFFDSRNTLLGMMVRVTCRL